MRLMLRNSIAVFIGFLVGQAIAVIGGSIVLVIVVSFGMSLFISIILWAIEDEINNPLR